MPLYEYSCRSCGRTMEAMQSFSDPPLTTCEDCGGELKKLLSAPAVQFKGSGWYVSDYARAGQGSGEKKGEGEARPETAAKEAGKSEGKDAPGAASGDSSSSASGGPAPASPTPSPGGSGS